MIVQRKADAVGPDSSLLRSGQRYTVFAILLSSPSHQFLVYEEQAFSFPIFVSSEVIDLVDARLSGHLHYSPLLPGTEQYSSRAALLAFQEMAQDRLFYQKLVEGNEDVNRVWQRMKRLMDMEADQSS